MDAGQVWWKLSEPHPILERVGGSPRSSGTFGSVSVPSAQAAPMGPQGDRPEGRPAQEGRDDRTAGELERRFGSRVRILARQHLALDRAETVVRRTLRRVEEAVGEGRARNPRGLGVLVYETALGLIDEERDRETSAGIDLLLGSEEREASARALDALDAEDREILRLAYRDGLCPDEIAGKLGVTPTEALHRKRQALERFIDRFSESAPGR